jgi:hypothetical protein
MNYMETSMQTDWENHRRALAAALNLGACLQVRGVERGANAACRPLTRQGITEAWSALQEAMPKVLAEEKTP